LSDTFLLSCRYVTGFKTGPPTHKSGDQLFIKYPSSEVGSAELDNTSGVHSTVLHRTR
jgi:hypothetical protein